MSTLSFTCQSLERMVLVTAVREGSFAVFSVTVSSIMDLEVDVFTV